MPYKMLVIESELAPTYAELWNDASLYRWGLSTEDDELLEEDHILSRDGLSFHLERHS